MTRLYVKNSNYNILSNESCAVNKGLTYVATTDDIKDFEPFGLDGKVYAVHQASLNKDGGYSEMIVSEVETIKSLEDVDEVWGEYEITCPVCGCEQGDSWEMDDESDDEFCENCGATYSYTRNVEVTYSSSLVKYPKHKKYKRR